MSPCSWPANPWCSGMGWGRAMQGSPRLVVRSCRGGIEFKSCAPTPQANPSFLAILPLRGICWGSTRAAIGSRQGCSPRTTHPPVACPANWTVTVRSSLSPGREFDCLPEVVVKCWSRSVGLPADGRAAARRLVERRAGKVVYPPSRRRGASKTGRASWQALTQAAHPALRDLICIDRIECPRLRPWNGLFRLQVVRQYSRTC